MINKNKFTKLFLYLKIAFRKNNIIHITVDLFCDEIIIPYDKNKE